MYDRIINYILQARDEFEWSEQVQGIILSAFYWGYVISHFPGGFLVQKYGGKYVLAFGILFSGLLSIAIPICVQYGLYSGLFDTVHCTYNINYSHKCYDLVGEAHSLIALQVLIGISQGPIISACLNLFSSWIPVTERCTIVSIAYAGITVNFNEFSSRNHRIYFGSDLFFLFFFIFR